MPARRTIAPRVQRRRSTALLDQVLIPPRRRRGPRAGQVAFQWYDGAGELHYCVLSPAQSWPYLVKD